MKINVLVLLVLLSAFAIATQETAELDSSVFNSNDPQNFNYLNGDYSSIDDWRKVNYDHPNFDWSKVPANQIKNIPAEKLNLNQLNSAQIGELTSSQKGLITSSQLVKCFDANCNLGNLAEFENAAKAIGEKYDLVIGSLGESATLQNGVLKATFGAEDSLNLNGKTGLWFKVNEHGEIVLFGGEEISEESIAESDSFTISPMINQNIHLKTKNGESLLVSGLSFRNGQAYIKAGETADVGTYVIGSKQNDVNVYLTKPENPQGNYVSIDEDIFQIGTENAGKVIVSVVPGNKLFRMTKRQYELESGKPIDKFSMVPDDRSVLVFSVTGGDSLDVRSREGKTPLIKHHNEGGQTKIKSGRLFTSIEEGTLYQSIKPLPNLKEGITELPNSVAFELESDSDNVASTLRTSSSNRFSLLQEGEVIATNSMGLEVSNSYEVNMMKTLDDLRVKYSKKYPGLEMVPKDFKKYMALVESRYKKGKVPAPGSLAESFDSLLLEGRRLQSEQQAIGNDISANMAQSVDQWLANNPDVAGKIRLIEFDTNFNAGADTSNPGNIILGERVFDPTTLADRPIRDNQPLGIIDHEIEHMKDHLNEEVEGQTTRPDGAVRLESIYEAQLKQAAKRMGERGQFNSLRSELKHLQRQIYEAAAIKDGKATKRQMEEFHGVVISEETYEPYTPEEINAGHIGLDDPIKKLGNAQFSHKHNFGSLASDIHDVYRSLRTLAEKYPYVERYRNRIEKLISDEAGGLPPYALRGYGKTHHTYPEVSSTFTEIDDSVLQRQVRSGNPFVINMVKAKRDAGHISEEKFNSLMGNYCDTHSCEKCEVYRWTCKK